MVKHVLLVEDNVETQTLLQTWLEIAGFTVSLAQDGHEALLLLESETPCVILLDLIMPSLDGYTLLEILERREPQKARLVIIITADVEALQKLAHKQVPILIKPFKFQPLLGLLQQYCLAS
jgi:CheY-like chemotaxis protein